MENLTLKKRNHFKNFVKKLNTNITVTELSGKPGSGKTIPTKERDSFPFFKYTY